MQVLVIGAGVVGLAVARAAAKNGHDVIVAEAENAIGTGVSSRNSEVIHAGMYYPTGSLRARHSVQGRRMLYAFCESHGVPHRKCGKLIVATSEAETAKVEQIAAQGRINDVEDLTMLTAAEARALEPQLSCTAALLSPQTGIVDVHSYMLALVGDIEDAGGAIAFNTPVTGAVRKDGQWLVAFGGDDAGEVAFDAVINCGGLSAQMIARTMPDYPSDRVPKRVLAKGNYFTYAGKPAFSHLIYPTPVNGGLGVHVTLDLAGRMRFGPDVEWIEEEYYPVDPRRADSFYERIRTYWPALKDNALAPDYSGIRPKLTGPGEPAADFLIDTPDRHGLPHLVQMFGIESPGLTSSLSLAETVVKAIE
ncbi:NAD(P)/FAD-dependent oxidoreductase [Undibacter mobilis]|uniref:NAD(P)/FAD-dependent oxidoreductase n=1 Tax=Undibacter mobilis TaxID=2292256 RepID=A0A371BAZ2_9BRAD|nr:NAD(P)/FAD-dependent oxidoreductase [Undibacter mobilis]RDV04531.1 NAD(P)/FAD-dependent oxidoreductase [Undibacter mobilis]